MSQLNVILHVCCLHVITGISNVTADTTNLINPLREKRETEHEMINSIVFDIIGVAAEQYLLSYI